MIDLYHLYDAFIIFNMNITKLCEKNVKILKNFLGSAEADVRSLASLYSGVVRSVARCSISIILSMNPN